MLNRTCFFLMLNFFVHSLMADDSRLIICFGNSYTEGMGASPLEAYPARLEEKLNNVKVRNAGVSGETAEEGLLRIEEDVLSHKPDLVIVEFGVNEAFRGYPVEESLGNIENIVQRIRSQGAQVIIVGVRFGAFQENFDRGLEMIAEKYKTGLVLDVLSGILDNPALKSDGYHPNAEGYRIMAERILPQVEKFIEDETQL